jgi:hypothetical protein
MARAAPRFRALALLACALAMPLAAGCGEKDEPSLSELDQQASQMGQGGGFEIEGQWRGELQQKGLKPFQVDATIGNLDEPKQNTVHYTGIDCSGNWTYEGRDGDAYTFREVIDRGEGGDCKGVGTVTLTPAGDERLDYVFRGGGIESRGVLSRAG